MAFELYKPDGAKASRGLIAFALGALLLYGSVSLYEYFDGTDWAKPFGGFGEVLGEEFPLSPRTLAAMLVIVGSAIGIWLTVNYAKLVDFLIETEAELKKVSWPSQSQVVSSSAIVVLLTVVMGVYIGLVDFGLIWALGKLYPKAGG